MKSDELGPIIQALEDIKEDKRVPKNIREGCKECMEILNDEEEDFSVKVNSCVSILDEISNDPNIPMYTRTQVWNIVSMLETVGVSEKT
ncbi:MAG: UPF0147 family protein [Candidatus Aenigmatarchaeota archaeon]